MRRTSSLAPLLAVVAALTIPSATAGPRTLDLKEFVERVRKNDPEARRIFHQRQSVYFSTDLALPAAPIFLRGLSQYGVSPDQRNETSLLSAEMSKSILSTGSRFSLLHEVSDQPNREEQVSSALLRQSLLRNAFGSQYRQQRAVLELENRALLLQSAEDFESYIADSISSYFDWKLTFLNFRTAEALWESSRKLQANIESRKKQNIASPLDVDKIRLQALSAEQTLVQLRRAWKEQSRVIERMTGEPSSLIRPAENASFHPGEIDYEKTSKSVLRAGRGVQILEIGEKVAEERVSLERKDLLPSLDAIVGYNRDNSTRFLTTVNRSEVQVGLQFEIPLWDSRNQAEVSQARFNRIRQELVRRAFIRDLEASLERMKVRIEEQKAELEVAREALDVARRIVKTERDYFRQGRIELENLIESTRLLTQAEFDYLSKEVQLSKTTAAWLALTDSLVDLSGLEVVFDGALR